MTPASGKTLERTFRPLEQANPFSEAPDDGALAGMETRSDFPGRLAFHSGAIREALLRNRPFNTGNFD